MKINLPVTKKECPLTEQHRLISTTDLKGIVTYANDDFVAVSGFSKEELYGKNHNIVRHPDMPVEAFEDLWTTIKAGKPWMGLVKNRCKNGDYYWVDAYVTPMYEKDQIIGYQSVRVKPDAESVKRAEKIYSDLLNKKKRLVSLPDISLSMRVFLTIVVIQLVFFGVLFASGQVTQTGLLMLLPVLLVTLGGLSWLMNPLKQVGRMSDSVVDNPLTQKVYIGSTRDIDKPMLAIRMLQARLRTVLGRISDASLEIMGMANIVAGCTDKTTKAIFRQQKETGQVATAMKEMFIAVRHVAENTQEAAGKASEAHDSSEGGRRQMDNIIKSINLLSEKLYGANTTIGQLEKQSNDIGVVLDVIKSIAEQTNLLALNAAIEAARAGDQGRGFAVVADEVRSLAQRTQQSTEEIEKMIPELQSGTLLTAQVIEECCKLAEDSVNKAAEGGKTLEVITGLVKTIDLMNEQVAAAAEEQDAVSGEISQNVSEISKLADESSENSRETLEANKSLLQVTQKFEGMTRQFSP